MTHNKPSNIKKETGSSTYTAYGDPLKSSKPNINNPVKKENSTIAESTQEDNSRKK